MSTFSILYFVVVSSQEYSGNVLSSVVGSDFRESLQQAKDEALVKMQPSDRDPESTYYLQMDACISQCKKMALERRKWTTLQTRDVDEDECDYVSFHVRKVVMSMK